MFNVDLDPARLPPGPVAPASPPRSAARRPFTGLRATAKPGLSEIRMPVPREAYDRAATPPARRTHELLEGVYGADYVVRLRLLGEEKLGPTSAVQYRRVRRAMLALGFKTGVEDYVTVPESPIVPVMTFGPVHSVKWFAGQITFGEVIEIDEKARLIIVRLDPARVPR